MNPPPVTLRVKSPDDLRGQLAMIRANAIAESLHRDLMVPRVSVPQTIPHATPKGDLTGTEKAASLVNLTAQRLELERAWDAAGTDYERADRIERAMHTNAARAATLARELGAMQSLRPTSRRSGRPGLYLIRVPAIEYAGRMGQGGAAGEAWVLDTHDLPDGLREALTAYLLSGAEMMPYRFRRDVYRYKAQSACTADTRQLMTALCAHLIPAAQSTENPRADRVYGSCPKLPDHTASVA